MATTTSDAPPIPRGLPYSVNITVSDYDTAPFPSGATIRGYVKTNAGSSTVIADLSTADGTITRVSDGTITVTMTAAQTAAIETSKVIVDFVRTDVDPDVYTYVQATIPVITPVTVGYS